MLDDEKDFLTPENSFGGPGEVFRNAPPGTMDSSGKRKWVYPAKSKGKLTDYRKLVSFVLLAVFFAVPFIKIGGNSFFKIDIFNRQFFIVGKAFYPQDLFVLAVVAITALVFLILFTVVFGRIFCGWICPQTIFMEHVFRAIEYAIEGDRNKQMRLDAQAWDQEKICKRLLKWSVFALISLLISHLMFSYIVGYERVLEIMKEGPIKNYDNFLVMVLFTGAFYFVFSWFREQVCTLVCPYGRLQGVLIDKQTINVYYDELRGEARSKWRKGEDRKAVKKGDCIDCKQCVVVCPTGIDIRNGQQLECINCTACIDACNHVMDKVGLSRGLIRYATQKEIERGEKFEFTLRMKAYALVLSSLVIFSFYLLLGRADVEAKFVKQGGSSYQMRNGKIYNLYEYVLLNKSSGGQILHFRVISPGGGSVEIPGGKNEIMLMKNASLVGVLNISFPEERVSLSKQTIVIGVYNQKGNKVDAYETYFEGPFKLSF